MNIDHLKYIVEVYKCRSINMAARNLYLTQPNLSNIIKNVEKEIEYAIFTRSKMGISVTAEGELFITFAKKMVVNYANIQQVPHMLKDEQNLALACSWQTFISPCFFEYQAKNPVRHVQDTYLTGGIRHTFNEVISGRCRLGMVTMFSSKIEKYHREAKKYDLAFTVVTENLPMGVFMAKDHPLANKEKIYPEDFVDYSFVTDIHLDYDDTMGFLKDMRNIIFVNDKGSVYDGIQQGECLSVGIQIPVGFSSAHGFISRPVENVNENLTLITLRQKHTQLNAREMDFLLFVEEKVREHYR